MCGHYISISLVFVLLLSSIAISLVFVLLLSSLAADGSSSNRAADVVPVGEPKDGREVLKEDIVSSGK